MSIKKVLQLLGKLAPVFSASADQVKFLNSPCQFYEAILSGIESAQRRISLGTLYLGTGQQEQVLVSTLCQKLATSENKDLQVHFHMDYLRGTRGHPKSSAGMLSPLLNYSGFKASMYLTPSLHSRWKRIMLPPRWNEIFGLSHLKICVFDNDIIMTGANLSESYFSNRTDRYVVIKQHEELANFFIQLLTEISKFSHQLTFSDATRVEFLPPELPISSARILIEEFLQSEINKTSDFFDGDLYFLPSIQMAPHAIRQDEKLLECLISYFNENFQNSDCSLATGYFNLSPLAQHIFHKAQNLTKPWKVLTCSPLTHGFFNAQGLSSNVPDIYRSIEYNFLKNGHDRPHLEKNGNGLECIYEYNKEGYSYHAKGIWLDDCDENIFSSIIGSSNFGWRSFERDLETQLIILTSNDQLIEQLRNERSNLFTNATMVSQQDIEQSGLPSYSVRQAASVIKSYL